MKFFWVIPALLIQFCAYANTPAPLIDVKQLTPTVKKRMLAIGGDHYTSVQQFQTSCGETLNPTEFHLNQMSFEVDADLETVWNTYLNSDPKNAWNGKMLQFDFAYSKRDQQVFYHTGAVPKAHVGMGIFMVLNLWNLKKLPAALELTKIDESTKTIEFTYLTVNTAHGRQTITLHALPNHRTRVDHNTLFKSESNFRDQFLYPKVHEALIEEFHENVFQYVGLHPQRTR